MSVARSTLRRRGGPQHGLFTLRRAVRDLGGRTIDGRTALGKALRRWRADLIADLGGPDAVSTQQLAIIDLAATTKLMVDSVDVWLISQPTLINRRKRMLLPVVLQRQQLADALARYMIQLGLSRRSRSVDLAQAFRQVSSDGSDDG